MYTAHPKIVSEQVHPHLSYLEAMELSFGAKVIYPLLQPLVEKTLSIKNTFAREDEGTMLTMVKTKQMDRLSKELVISTMFPCEPRGSGMVGIPVFKTFIRVTFHRKN